MVWPGLTMRDATMGDMSAEPSMEEILSSIKRIIAEEGDGVPARQRRPQRAAVHPPEPASAAPVGHAYAGHAPAHNGQGYPGHSYSEQGHQLPEEVLELSDPMPQPPQTPQPSTPPRAQPATAAAPSAPTAESIMSSRTADATRGSLDALTKLVVKPESGGDGTLEGLVREMLRPMLREWLDARLPDMVEELVSREIAKITGQSR